MYFKSYCLLLLLIVSINAEPCFGNSYDTPTFYLRNQQAHFHHNHNSIHHPHRRRHRSHHHSHLRPIIINVDDFGAKADGTDDSEAFQEAWMETCSYGGDVKMVVPKNKVYVLKPINFSGPCQPNSIAFKVYGSIEATINQSDFSHDRRHWIRFTNVTNLRVSGGGIINGNGNIWWENSCKRNKTLPCTDAPTAVTFYECTNLMVSHIKFRNAQQMHLVFQKCINVKVIGLLVTAPGNSPNTDGIHVTATQDIKIMDSIIRTGDDCISIVSGSRNVHAIGITCGPGHGISIGSLGAGNATAYVSNVLVDKARISGTTNGVRIKTWQGGSGYAKNIIFQNVIMHNVSNPIIIDQNYCDQTKPCVEEQSAVQISNVIYKNIIGTSASADAIKFNCSKSFPCEGIWLQDVRLVRQELNVDQNDHQENNVKDAKASCSDARVIYRGKVSPRCPN